MSLHKKKKKKKNALTALPQISSMHHPGIKYTSTRGKAKPTPVVKLHPIWAVGLLAKSKPANPSLSNRGCGKSSVITTKRASQRRTLPPQYKEMISLYHRSGWINPLIPQPLQSGKPRGLKHFGSTYHPPSDGRIQKLGKQHIRENLLLESPMDTLQKEEPPNLGVGFGGYPVP